MGDRLTLVQDYRGLAYRSPLLGGALAFFLISLIGIPFTGGFFAKFYAFTTAMQGGAAWLALIGLLNSGLAAAYYLKLVVSVAQSPVAGTATGKAEPGKITVGAAAGAALAFAALATLLLGIAPGRVLGAARSAADSFVTPAGPIAK
jgi:NADH-quinone oxidoreductase subunit N